MTTDHNEAMRLADSLSTISAIIKFALSWDDSGQGDQYAIQWPERPKRAEGKEWVKCLEQSDAILRKQAAELKSARAETNRIIALLDAANDERKALRAEVERLKPNAERYEWLCEKLGETQLPTLIERITQGYVADYKPSIDAAIDTARKATQ